MLGEVRRQPCSFRWKRMLESEEFATIAELAEREKMAPSYMTRVMRLTLFAPEIVEAILDGTQGPGVTLARVLEPLPSEWDAQSANSMQKSYAQIPEYQRAEHRSVG
jgi:hypothetical protein